MVTLTNSFKLCLSLCYRGLSFLIPLNILQDGVTQTESLTFESIGPTTTSYASNTEFVAGLAVKLRQYRAEQMESRLPVRINTDKKDG